MKNYTEFEGRNGVLAWSLLPLLYVWAAAWYSLERPFEISLAFLPTIGPIICGMIALLALLRLAKDRVEHSGQRIDRAITYVLRSLQLFIACYLFLLLYAITSTVLTYIGQATGAPLQDEALAAADAALGFDWVGLHAWLVDKPLLAQAMFYAYNSVAKQFLVVFLVCAIFQDRETAAQFCALLALTVIPTIILSAMWPALGTCIHYQPTAQPFADIDPMACRWYLAHVEALRAGTFDVLDVRRVEGLVTFPSYHTVMAILCVYAVRRYLWLLMPFAVLNAVNILATLPFGGHYFVDVAGGAAIAFAAIAFVRWNAARQAAPATMAAAQPAAVVGSAGA